MERYIAEHGIERNEKFKENGALRGGGITTAMRMGMKDMTYSRKYRAMLEFPQHGPILRGKCLVFVYKVRGQILKVVKSCE